MLEPSLLVEDALLPVPVLVVEDEPLLQERLRQVLKQLGYEDDALIVTSTLAEARAVVAEGPVGLALVDLRLPDGNGQSLIEELRAEDPGLGILVVSAWSSEELILSALRAGATGYVLKQRDDFEVMLSIRSVLRGGAPIDPFIARRILQLLPMRASKPADSAVPAAHGGEPDVGLTPREAEILRLVADGMSNREIADAVHLSRHTVESHVKRIYRKLAVSSRMMAVREARARGMIE
ncbi:response regulator [Comamonas koreensis]|uniref:Response regulator transcription factor n=1 Tax=Comamonas koreensis TaxID=160825 RepID=A0AAW4XXH3_9BURK|nr:response regulator transcription factor [Comamonas koreensis]MCD2165514.1 response regulator transcription factor [Comamonas koreensis]